MNKETIQETYKGILFNIEKDTKGYSGYLLDIEYNFNTRGSSAYEVRSNIKNFKDTLVQAKDYFYQT